MWTCVCNPFFFFFFGFIYKDIKWNHWDESSDCEFVIPKSLVSDCFNKCVEMFKEHLFCL